MSFISINHNAGFFSNCSVKLFAIIKFINEHKRLPIIVDSSNQFLWYKINIVGDITYHYFEHYDNIPECKINYPIKFEWEEQYTDYSKLEFNNLCPIMYKYFTISKEIKNIIINIKNKYNINYDNTCVLFYRGNDKNTETTICGYNEYINIAREIIYKNPNIKFLIQSDETEFIELFIKLFPNNSFYFKDEIRHVYKCNNTVDKLMANLNYIFSKFYLAITVIMSKCKYVVCGSGNCSLWIILYRENCNNVYQNLNGKWIVTN